MNDEVPIRVAISADDWEPWLLRQALAARIASEPSTITFVLESERRADLRDAVGSTLLIALLSGSGALGVLLSGVLGLLRDKTSRKITIQGRSGWRLECPTDVPPSTLSALIDVAKTLDVDAIGF